MEPDKACLSGGLNLEVNSAVDHRQQQFFPKVWSEDLCCCIGGSVLQYIRKKFGKRYVCVRFVQIFFLILSLYWVNIRNY